ncbi:MAG: LCP family protein [Chloroflexota bacterium]|nr:LCP family protein [Chloroflexota bacterium]
MSRRQGAYPVPPRQATGAYDDWRGDRYVPPRMARRSVPRRRPWGRIVLVTFLVLLIAVLAASLLLWFRVAAFNDRVSTASATSSSLFGPLGGDERVNVLVLGYGGAEHDGTYLTDSINIVSVDPGGDTTTMIAIPRDLWIEGVPALPQNGKVNEAFADGYAAGGTLDAGAEASVSVLSAVTGLPIDHWVALDFNGFRRMVDAVGGVTIDNPTAFSYTRDENFFNAGRWEAEFPAGELHLDGEQALTYTRARYTSVPSESSDFARSVRQQRVLSALRDRLGDGGISSIGPGLRIMDALGEDMRTDLSAIDLFLLSSHVDPDRRVELTEGVILQATTNTIGQYILVVIGSTGPGDYAPLHAYIQGQLDAPASNGS